MGRRIGSWILVTTATAALVTACATPSSVTTPAPSSEPAPTAAPSVAGAASATACAATDQRVDRDVAYGPVAPGTDPNLRSLDVYSPVLPAGCPPAPVVVYVHGGGWQRGDKKAVGAKADLAREQGWVLVSVNYQLAPAVTYPTFNDDVADAVVCRHATTPPTSAATRTGSSSWVTPQAQPSPRPIATDERSLQRAGADLSAVRCAVPIDSAYDVVIEAGADKEIYRQAFGDDPAVWADASPLGHVAPDKGIPPFLFVTRGRDAWTAKAERFAGDLQAAGVPTTLVDAGPTVSHEDVNQMIGTPGDRVVTPAVVDFVERCGT